MFLRQRKCSFYSKCILVTIASVALIVSVGCAGQSSGVQTDEEQLKARFMAREEAQSDLFSGNVSSDEAGIEKVASFQVPESRQSTAAALRSVLATNPVEKRREATKKNPDKVLTVEITRIEISMVKSSAIVYLRSFNKIQQQYFTYTEIWVKEGTNKTWNLQRSTPPVQEKT